MRTVRWLGIAAWVVSWAGTASGDTYYKVTADVHTGQVAPVEIWSGGVPDTLIPPPPVSIPFGYSFLYPQFTGTPIDVQFTNFLPPEGEHYGMCTHLYDAVNVTGGHLDLSSSDGIAKTDVTVVALGSVDVTKVYTVASGKTSTAAQVGLYGRDIKVRYAGGSDEGWIDTRAGDAVAGKGGDITLIAKHGDVVVDKGLTAYCPVPQGYEQSDDKSGYLFVNASRRVTLPASRYYGDVPEFNFNDFSRWPGGVELNAGGHVSITGKIGGFDPAFNLNGDGTPYHVFPERQFCSRGAVLYDPEMNPNLGHKVYVLPAEPYRDLPDAMNGRLMPSDRYDYSRENDIVRIWDVRSADENEIKRNWIIPDDPKSTFGAQLVEVDRVSKKMTVQERFASRCAVGGEVVTDFDGRFCALGTPYVSRYFDTIIDYDKDARDIGAEWTFQFDIENLTPNYDKLWDWIGFKLEFWNADFTQRLDGLQLAGRGNNVGFEQSSYGGGVLSFWSDKYARHDAGDTHSYWVTVNLSQIGGDGAGQFGVRQIPLVVPEPALLGVGVLILAMAQRRRS